MAESGTDHSNRVARTAALTLFSIVLAHTLVETARDALFLASISTTRLPFVYALIALVTLAARRAARLMLRRLQGIMLLRALLLASAAITLAFWGLTAWRSPWILVALYVWPSIFAGIVIIQFWHLLADAFTAIEAKTVFSRVGGGAAAGGLAGGIISLALSLTVQTRHLLLAGGLVLAATAMLLRSNALDGGQAPLHDTPIPSLTDGTRRIVAQPYLRRVFGLLLVTTVMITMVDYIFKSVVADTVPAENLATLFAGATLLLSLAGMLVQLTMAERLVRWLGVVRTLAVLPATLSAAALGVAMQAGPVSALVLKTLDGALRNSVHRTATELLYVPMSMEVRASVKGVTDVLAQRGGQLAGSALILAVIAAGGGYHVLAVTVAGLSIASLITVVRLRDPYLGLFRETLQSEAAGARPSYPRLRLRSIPPLMSALGSEDDKEVLAAMSLLAEGGQLALLPGVMVFHPSPAVVLRALDLFSRDQQPSLGWAARRLFQEHADDDVRAAALRAQLAVLDDPGVLEAALADRSPVVRATAVVGLISRGQADAPPVAAALAALRADAEIAPQLALARAIRLQPSEHLEDLLLELASIDHPDVHLECVAAMAESGGVRFLPVLLGALCNRPLRAIARAGFVRLGMPALTLLAEALADRSTPLGIRLHIPRSISRFRADMSIPILLRELLREEDGALRFKIVRGLGRLRVDAPEVPIDDQVLEQTLRKGLEEALRLKHWRAVIGAQAGGPEARPDSLHRLLSDLIADEQAQSTETVFRLLDIRYPAEKFEHVFLGLRGSPTAQASSLEIIGHAVNSPLKEAVLALSGENAGEAPVESVEAIYATNALTVEAVTAEIIEHAPGPLRVIAARYAGERGFTALRDSIARFVEDEPAAFRGTLNTSLALLERDGHAA